MLFRLSILAFACLVMGERHEPHHHDPPALPRHGLGKLEKLIKEFRKEYSKPMRLPTDEEIERQERIKETESYIIN